MKKAILISCFGWRKGRLEYVDQYLRCQGYEALQYTADYNHERKVYIEPEEGVTPIHVRPYKKNLSFARLYSHYDFSKQVYKLLSEERPDFVYGVIPPNSVASACAKYKRKHPESKLVYDIIDMWPESYTARQIMKLPFKMWASLRDSNLQYADHVFTECSLYQSFLPQLKSVSALRLCRDQANFADVPVWDGKVVDIAYLGSINNIIDIPGIESLIAAITKHLQVNVHIVGGGESQDAFVNALERAGAKVHNHGKIFDRPKMQAIIGSCHFALNMMKESVCVGLTIKSMDYFQLGVPLLNTIKGDTSELLSKYRCGYNVDDIIPTTERLRLLDQYEYQQMRNNVQKAFVENLTLDAFERSLEEGLNNVLATQ